MFALSLVDFLSLLLSPSTYFKIFYFCQKYHLKDTYKIFKKIHVASKFEWGLYDQYWLSCERLAFEVFLSCLFDGPLRIAYANMLATTQWPLERAVHLTSLVWVCVLWLPESLMDLSALWYCLTFIDTDFTQKAEIIQRKIQETVVPTQLLPLPLLTSARTSANHGINKLFWNNYVLASDKLQRISVKKYCIHSYIS